MQNEQRAYHLDEGTIQNILQAEHYISASLQDETSLSRVAQDIEFEKIVNELRAIDLPNTTEEYLIAQQFKDKQWVLIILQNLSFKNYEVIFKSRRRAASSIAIISRVR